MIAKENPASTALHNFPIELIPLVGREKEIAEISELLCNPNIRLITLHGFGGSGKTRLAVETGKKVLESFPDGVWFVPLAPVNSPDAMLPATTSALGFPFASPSDQKKQLHHFLQEKHLLLIFDNLEHLLPEVGAFIEEILQNAPLVRLLVTTRQPLNTPWEWAYAISGLDYSEKAGGNGEIPAASALFLQHLRRRGAAETAEETKCASQISQMVAGLPLALLLAASWGRALGCEEIVAEIRQGIDFLKARHPSFPDHHSSMRAVFDHSWKLLSDKEKIILAKLSVFRGGFNRTAVSTVTGAEISDIASLVDQSLIERVANKRYQIHELLRQYLNERLLKAGEDQITRDAHLTYYTNLSEEAEPELYRGQQRAWIDRLNGEIDNMRAALEWSLEKQDPVRIELGLRMLTATGRLWILPLYTRSGMAYLVQLLNLASGIQSQGSYVRALNLAGWLSYLLEELPESRNYTAQALQINQTLPDIRLTGDSYHVQSLEAFYRKDHKAAQSFALQALACYQEASDVRGTLQSLECLGRCNIYNSDFSAGKLNLTAALDLAKKLGDIRIQYSILRGLGELGLIGGAFGLEQSKAYLEEGLVYARQFNDKFYINHTVNSLGEIARVEGQFEQAVQYYEEAIFIDKELGLIDEVILHEGNLGFVYSRLGKAVESKLLFLKNLDLALKSDHLPVEITTCLLGLAGVAAMEGEARQGAKYLGAIDSVKEPLLFSPTERSDYERTLAAVRSQLTQQKFEEFFKEGLAMGQVRAAQAILNPEGKESSSKSERLHGLTAREVEVLRLVTLGLSDQEVAGQLVISPRTVNAHLTSIFGKLGVNSRAAAARFAREKGLT